LKSVEQNGLEDCREEFLNLQQLELGFKGLIIEGVVRPITEAMFLLSVAAVQSGCSKSACYLKHYLNA